MRSESGPDQLDWRCCLPTSDETTVSLSCPLEQGQPWLAGRALDILRQWAGVRSDPAGDRYVVGRRRGPPLILGEPLLWNGLPLVVEACEIEAGAAGEVTLRLPPWTEIASKIPERQLWEITDRLADEFSSSCGVVSDGRAVGYPELTAPQMTALRLQRLHLGVLVPPDWLAYLRPGSTPYLRLPRSQLVLVLE